MGGKLLFSHLLLIKGMLNQDMERLIG